MNREKELLKRYGLSVETYEEICVKQNHSCAICGKHEDDTRHNKLSVDHDHVTGLVRGLLCANCNFAIGNMQDSAGLLRAAAEYLEKNRARDDFGRQPASTNWIWSSELKSGQEATI